LAGKRNTRGEERFILQFNGDELVTQLICLTRSMLSSHYTGEIFIPIVGLSPLVSEPLNGTFGTKIALVIAEN
jgi:hypothetical protein